jgi:hypothetical protein
MTPLPGPGVPAAVACIAALAAACSSGESSSRQAATPDKSRTESYAGATQATTGAQGWTLLDIPEIGSLVVSCAQPTRRRVTFTVAPQSASSVVTVTSSHGTSRGGFVDPGRTHTVTDLGPASQQTWQITPVTPAEGRVAVLVVSSMPAPAALGGQGCVASATGTVTQTTE